jgi:membrane dipeptidase
MLIVDAHLDLAYNALDRGRDVTRPAVEQPMADNEIATVGLPDLHKGGVGLICATIFCAPRKYKTADEARALALNQLAWYRRQIDEGRLTFCGTGSLPVHSNHRPAARAPALPAILLMEGADAFRSADDVPEWFNNGLRIVGLAWGQTRAAGGTGAPGPLTDFGRSLIPAFDKAGIIHDLSHLADESFWQLLDLATGPVMASHSNCRAIVPTDRQLSDEMIRAIAGRDGVIGINFYDQFLQRPEDYRKKRCTLADLIAHIQHIADLLSTTKNIGIGSDMDGGLGREEIPKEITTAADLPRLGEALSGSGFSDDDVLGIMGGNWLRFFGAALPRQ